MSIKCRLWKILIYLGTDFETPLDGCFWGYRRLWTLPSAVSILITFNDTWLIRGWKLYPSYYIGIVSGIIVTGTRSRSKAYSIGKTLGFYTVGVRHNPDIGGHPCGFPRYKKGTVLTVYWLLPSFINSFYHQMSKITIKIDLLIQQHLTNII